ncbi:glycosyltransferase family 4 protein [Cellulophaga omnivescoria]|uniref:glycosyltransferase family 4 protein n=1 Tax=Cellulophaga omnivescoria TaxID=1888890 RepID=UPI0009856D16|nr:glycosyltransferase family 4 protein [Cellulophaga omnivescoria]WBU90697.1 glycosyltransferase family 4 protein [Cellulophaga omnivescoria]
MRKLHLISAMYSTKGHGFEYVRNFCDNLKSEFNIILHLASDTEIDTPPNIKVNYTGVNYVKTDAKNFVKYGKFAPYFRAIMKQYVSYCYYKKIVKSGIIQKNDLVYIMDYDVIPLLTLIKKLNKKGVIKTFLWIHSAKFQSKDIIYSLYKSVFKYIFNNKILNNIQGIVVNGKYIKSEISKFLKIQDHKIHIIQYPSSIPFKKVSKPLARKELGLKQNDNVILFFGMLRKDKNIEFTIENVSKSNKEPKLIIAGSEASVTKEDIDKWITKHNMKNYMLDIDYISEEKMALYYSCSDLLILTYELESGSQSGPLSLAREFELPALVTNTGEIGKYVIDNNVGLTADVVGENSFVKKIDYFFNMSNDEQEGLKKSLITAKDKFSWKEAKKKYLILFDV